MAEIVLDNGTVIGNQKKPYIIAEVNSSHNGDLELAKRMILEAKACGCSCVKFQSWTEESLYAKTYYKENPIAKRIIKKFSLSKAQLIEIKEFCDSQKIDFASTPYSREEVDFLIEQCHVPFIKISSMEINNIDYLAYIASKGKPMIMSTGMATFDEVASAVDTIRKSGNHQLAILHCVSVYPVEPEHVNLNNIVTLIEQYPDYTIGYSDHTQGYEVAIGAVALGAGIIEKHFTLDNTKMGMDNNMATEPDTMKKLVDKCNLLWSAMGSKARQLSTEELEQQKKMRRSLVTKECLKEGSILSEKDIIAKRPGSGIPVNEKKKLIGRSLLKSLEKESIIRWEDVK